MLHSGLGWDAEGGIALNLHWSCSAAAALKSGGVKKQEVYWIFLPDHPLLLEKFQILQMLGLGKLARGWVFSFVAGKELILGRLPQFGVGWVLRHFENFFV